jgi:hypothetical protein
MAKNFAAQTHKILRLSTSSEPDFSARKDEKKKMTFFEKKNPKFIEI